LTLALPARAKLNLDLSVVSKRADGFHELRTTFQAIDLHDLLVVSPANETLLTISGLSVGKNDNSVLKAQQALEDAARRKLPADIHLHKRIPPGSGMGGASSDAAAALRGLKAAYGLDADLGPIAKDLGADVTFFLHGGKARAEGRGEQLSQLASEPAWFAVAWPGFELSTAAVYGAWDEVKGEGPNHLRRAAEHVEPRLVAFAGKLGAGWQMTGSGSAFFKACANDDEARRAIKGLDVWTAVTQPIEPWA
jgi:4-diphosphocytidyl-2-C-methyl-D-erythritol kinase